MVALLALINVPAKDAPATLLVGAIAVLISLAFAFGVAHVPGRGMQGGFDFDRPGARAFLSVAGMGSIFTVTLGLSMLGS